MLCCVHQSQAGGSGTTAASTELSFLFFMLVELPDLPPFPSMLTVSNITLCDA